MKKWQKVGKSGEKLEYVGKAEEKRGKVAKSWKKWNLFLQNGRRRPFWMCKNHFRSHFSPFQINTQLLFFEKKFKMAAGRHFGAFWMTENHFRSHFSPFQINTQLFFFFNFFFKMVASGHFGSPICAKNNRVLPLCVINGYAKYEVDR